MPYNPGTFREFIRPIDEEEDDQVRNADKGGYVPQEEIPDPDALTEDEMLAKIDDGQPVVGEEAEENFAVQEPGIKDRETSTLSEEIEEDYRQDEAYRKQEPAEIIGEETLLPAERELLDLDEELDASVNKDAVSHKRDKAGNWGRNHMRGHESITQERRTKARKRIQRFTEKGK